MTTTDAVLQRGIEGCGDDRILTLDPLFQGLPDTAHGGSVLAVFEALDARPGRRVVRGVYRRRVPLGVPLRLLTTQRRDGFDCRLLDASDGLLVDGHVEPAGDDVRALEPIADAPRHELPVTTSCFACGVQNAIGLRARLAFDDAVVAGQWEPREQFALADGALAPVVLTTLLDETAFWLGALASGESGMTTELQVTLAAPGPLAGPITVGGRRHTVRAADDPRYWRTEVSAWDAVGRILADARITFVAVRGSARRLAAWLLRVNPADVVRRVFPAYAS